MDRWKGKVMWKGRGMVRGKVLGSGKDAVRRMRLMQQNGRQRRCIAPGALCCTPLVVGQESLDSLVAWSQWTAWALLAPCPTWIAQDLGNRFGVIEEEEDTASQESVGNGGVATRGWVSQAVGCDAHNIWLMEGPFWTLQS